VQEAPNGAAYWVAQSMSNLGDFYALSLVLAKQIPNENCYGIALISGDLESR
jgi:hypothetical protein